MHGKPNFIKHRLLKPILFLTFALFAVSLNGFDPMVLAGIPGLKTPLPMILGADIAAEIVELGSAVNGGKWN